MQYWNWNLAWKKKMEIHFFWNFKKMKLERAVMFEIS